MNLPNKLSIARLCLIPVMMTTFYIDFPYHYLVSCIVFAIAAFTDFLDGYIARKYNLVTDFGKFLDSSADKVLVLIALIVMLDDGLLTAGIVPEFIGGTFIAVILAREILISCLRMVTAAKGVVMAADKLGKAKTVLQVSSIIILMFAAEFSVNGSIFKLFDASTNSSAVWHHLIYWIGFACLSVAVVMTIISGVHYLYVYGKDLEKK